MACWLKKFGINIEGKPIVLKTDMRKYYNEDFYALNDEDLLKYISSYFDLDTYPYEDCRYATPGNYRFISIGDCVDSDPGLFLNVIKDNSKIKLRVTDYDTTRVIKTPNKCCIL
jgi:hypothetical protein